MTSCHSIEMTPLLILLSPCFTALPNSQSSFYIKGTSHYSSKGKGAEDLGLNKVKFRRSLLITFDDFRVPPLPPLSSLSKQILVLSAPPPGPWILPTFSVMPPFGFSALHPLGDQWWLVPNNYSSSLNGLLVNSLWGRMGYWLRGHKGERNKLF